MKERHASYLLVLASFLWGLTFVFQNSAADLIGPLTYNGVRMLIGAVVLSPFALKSRKLHKGDAAYSKTLLTGGLVCGFFIASASFFQQYGIAFTSTGRAGFLTSIYTLLVPVFSIVIGKKVSLHLWLCVFAGLLGAFLLSTGAGEGAIGFGDLMIIICAVLFTFQIMAVDHFSPSLDGTDLSFLQFLFGGAGLLILALFFEDVSWSVISGAWIQILYAGIFSCGVAYTLQIIGQKYVQPTKATLILCLESVWAAIGGAIIFAETMTLKELCGCTLLFLSVAASQLRK